MCFGEMLIALLRRRVSCHPSSLPPRLLVTANSATCGGRSTSQALLLPLPTKFTTLPCTAPHLESLNSKATDCPPIPSSVYRHIPTRPNALSLRVRLPLSLDAKKRTATKKMCFCPTPKPTASRVCAPTHLHHRRRPAGPPSRQESASTTPTPAQYGALVPSQWWRPRLPPSPKPPAVLARLLLLLAPPRPRRRM